MPFKESYPGAAFVLAFRALPIVLLLSAFSAVLWHWRVMPMVIRWLALGLKATLKIDGPVALGAAAKIFVGIVEAAILIRPHLARISRSDLFVMMTTGLTTLAGTVLVLYATFLQGVIENAAGHLLVASLISAPAAIVVARLMVPPSDGEAEAASSEDGFAETRALYDSTMDAMVQGTQDGLRLLLNIIAMLIVFVTMVALINQLLGLFPDLWGDPVSLQRLLGWVLAPVAWLIGTKIVLNELIAYLNLAAAGESLSERSRVILLYVLASFANFGSVGIMLAGMIAMAPDRKSELVSLGLRSLVAGTIATCMTSAVVALVI